MISDLVRRQETPIGGIQFLTSGDHTWVVPRDVYSICAVLVGAGGGSTGSGGGGGSLRWINKLEVSPGQEFIIRVAEARANLNGQSSAIFNPGDFVSPVIYAGGGYTTANQSDGSPISGNIGGGNGGIRGGSEGAGGGGAGGYNGNGGNGSYRSNGGNADSASGAGGGGCADNNTVNPGRGYGGGGVGLFGRGPSGLGGKWGTLPANNAGKGGSYGENGTSGHGAIYGGGVGGGSGWSFRTGGPGAVRIIWGQGRFFPTTNVHEMIQETIV